MESLSTHKVVVELSAKFAEADMALKKLEARADEAARRVGGSMSKLERLGARGRGVSGLKGVGAGLIGGAIGGPAGFIAGMATFAAIDAGINLLSKAFFKAQTAAERFANRLEGAQLSSAVASGQFGKTFRDMLFDMTATPEERRKREIDDIYNAARHEIADQFGKAGQAAMERRDAAKTVVDRFAFLVASGTALSPYFQRQFDKAKIEYEAAQTELDANKAAREAAEKELDFLKQKVESSQSRGTPTFDTIGTVFGSMRVAAGSTKKPATEDGQKRIDTATQKVAKATEGILRFLQRSGLEGFA